MFAEGQSVTVTYKSGIHPTHGWDTVQVIYSQEGRVLNSFVIARDAAGTIVRRIGVLPEEWQIITDANDLGDFRKCFDDRDRLAFEQCRCGHAYAAHSRDVLVPDTTRADDALLPSRSGDIYSDKPVGESGCTECDCLQYKPTGC